MKFRLYWALQVGDGTHSEDAAGNVVVNAFRPCTSDFCMRGRASWVNISCNTRKRVFTAIFAEQSVHDAIYADRLTNGTRIIYLSPLFGTWPELQAFLNTRYADLPLATRTAVENKFSADGVLNSIGANDLIKDVLRRAAHYLLSQQFLNGGRTVPVDIGPVQIGGLDL